MLYTDLFTPPPSYLSGLLKIHLRSRYSVAMSQPTLHIKPLTRNDSGAAAYTPWVLYIYDWLVLFVTNTFAWKCSTKNDMLPLFQSTLSEKHLEIGVGTGYFPARALGEAGSPCKHITLVDLNPSSLAAAKDRISAAVPSQSITIDTVVADAMKPLPFSASEKFGSITMFYLIHCIPAPPEDKNRVFDAARQHLAPDGTLAGATVLGRSRPMNWLARILMNTHNKSGIFNNWNDSEEIFKRGLQDSFEHVETWVVGRSMLFRARKPKQQ
ncbi:S-adenosyl-L-methionine-dependent methyltransferase [Thelonectria olida]|uniref:S-adenosyl-L-methionine-dependent methyltransferase n=1 Tax=Thelonectria olida TaxID=1576542 RepID=A0A9P8VW13_9HYPO|nr:S-adenosyl-L-methionine-dependent methyltransferase [Thelonectria olida]